MADHGSSGSHSTSHGSDDHRSTYEGFLKGSVALTLICLFILVALVAFRFAGSGNVLLGFAGLILGILAVLIDSRAGKSWYLSGGLLVVFGLITAVAVS
jgi:lipopolysaccharide export LptBFGC system permease protein LptF